MIAESKDSGYRLQRVYVSDQVYRLVAGSEELRDSDDRSNRLAHFGWDWRPIGPRQFEIVLEIRVDPIKLSPEEARVRVIGVFEAVGDALSLDLRTFLTQNGPAILFPYAREAISTMTGRGPHGAFHLNPINVAALSQGFDFEATGGARYLKENPAFGATFGLNVGSSAALTDGR